MERKVTASSSFFCSRRRRTAPRGVTGAASVSHVLSVYCWRCQTAVARKDASQGGETSQISTHQESSGSRLCFHSHLSPARDKHIYIIKLCVINHRATWCKTLFDRYCTVISWSHRSGLIQSVPVLRRSEPALCIKYVRLTRVWLVSDIKTCSSPVGVLKRHVSAGAKGCVSLVVAKFCVKFVSAWTRRIHAFPSISAWILQLAASSERPSIDSESRAVESKARLIAVFVSSPQGRPVLNQ